jgi:hypothetical protein
MANRRVFLGAGLAALSIAIISFFVAYKALSTHAPSSAPDSPTPAFTVQGSGFAVATLENGGIAFSDRKYVWAEIPARFAGWQYTQTAGGKKPQMTVKAQRAEMLYVATGAEPGVDLTGWEAVTDAPFHYTDAKKTEMRVYRRMLTQGQELEIPQGNWTGTLVLLPQ